LSAADWQPFRLGELGTSYGGLAGKSGSDFGIGSSRYVTFLNVVTNVVLDEAGVGVVNVGPDERQSAIQPGDLLFNASSETPDEAGFASAVPDGLSGLHLNSFCFGLRPYPDAQLDARFFAFLSRSDQGRLVIRPMAQGSTRYNISAKRMLSASFLLPPLPEQRAIAEALSDASHALDALESLLAKKQAIRIAAAQQLLSGDNQLLGFETPWAHRALGDVAHITKGVQLGRAQMSSTGAIPVWNGGVEPSGFTQSPNIRRDVVTVSEGGSCGWVGRPRSDFWLGGHCYALDPNPFAHSVPFLYHALKAVETELNRLGVGSGLQNIQLKSLAEFKIRVPVDSEEASVISEILDDLDAEVLALSHEREKMKLVKQGMMQELLSGRVRLS
jgi:restriction endonuclease S subunit